MVSLKNSKKAAELALNTIVIALLVIIVMVVVVVFFTSSVGNSGETLNKASSCSYENGALATIYEQGKDDLEPLKDGETSCTDKGDSWKSVIGYSGCCVLEKE